MYKHFNLKVIGDDIWGEIRYVLNLVLITTYQKLEIRPSVTVIGRLLTNTKATFYFTSTVRGSKSFTMLTYACIFYFYLFERLSLSSLRGNLV